jgi:hypothetical protein
MPTYYDETAHNVIAKGMIAADLRAQWGEIFNYQTLLTGLTQYASPRDKISDLLRKKVIIRIKKGLYVFARDSHSRPYCLETLANLIYGPSYVSLDYALQIHGLIPERVETVTSVTLGQSKYFSTPLGNFSYRKIRLEAYATGMDLIKNRDGNTYLLATPEKALVDKLLSDRGIAIRTQVALEEYLTENLRMEISDLIRMKAEQVELYAKGYRSRKAELLARLIRRKWKETGKH